MKAQRWEQLPLPDEYLPLPRVTAVGRQASIQARAEIVRLRGEGYGLTEVARSLNARGIPTPSGRGHWWPDSVRRHVEPGPWAEYVRRYRAARRT